MKAINKTMAVLAFSVASILISPAAAFSNEMDTLDEIMNIGYSLEENILSGIQDYMYSAYGDRYELDNFEIEMSDPREEDDYKTIDVDLHVDMKSTVHPEEAPLIVEMRAEAENLSTDEEKAMADSIISTFLTDMYAKYNNSSRVTVLFTVKFENDSISKNNFGDYRIYTRLDIDAENRILTSLDDELQSTNQIKASKSGNESVLRSLIDANLQNARLYRAASVSYDRLEAAEYARDHREDDPEFYKNGDSDCANFVSKAVNEGGIPEDEDDNWYGSSTWGDRDTAGTWWYRTGYHKQSNGYFEGVTTYLVNEGLFYKKAGKSTAFAGGILFVTNKSHVGLVTSGNGQDVYYADHSDEPKSGEETLLSSSNYLNKCTFYLPYSSILAD